MERRNPYRQLAPWALTLALACLAPAGAAQAQASLIGGLGGPAGFGAGVLPANDDGSSAAIDLSGAFPAGLNFFGTTHTAIFVNNNGNVTFAGPVGAFTPEPFPVAARPMIAPWWGDVDTRNTTLGGGQNLVYWDVAAGRFVATWYNVGYYSSHVDRLNAFQLVLTDQSASGAAGDFDVELRYNRCEWTTGDASGGSGGLGGTPAQAGFDAGDSVNYVELPGSRTAAILALCTTSNVADIGVWRFQIRSGAITQCGNGVLESGEECDDGNAANGDGCNERCEIELPPGSACTVDIHCLSGFCTDGVCCDARCDGQCEACNRAGAAGACGPVVGAPVGGRPACGGAGACGGSCDGTVRLACAYPGASTACDDGLFCTDGDACDGAGACASGAARVCDDGLACTSGSCDEAADTCVHALVTGCLIGGACVAEGAVSPTNQCEVCAPSTSTDAYAPAPAGTTCDDGLFCTVTDACNGAGSCTGAARDCGDGVDCTTDTCDEAADACVSVVVDACWIGDACLAAGTPNPANQCEVCAPATSTTEWTPASSGTSCDDGLFCTDVDSCDGAGGCAGTARDCGDGLGCTTDTCDEALGECVSVLAAGCLIDGVCAAEGSADPADGCRVCDPATSTAAWTGSMAPECLPDAGPPDGGPPDAGPPDAGPPDGGPPDASPDAAAPDLPYEVRGSGLCSAASPASGGSAPGLLLTIALMAFVTRRWRRG